jgi:hypothetical protein
MSSLLSTEINQLRAALAEARRRHGRAYPAELRAQVLRLVDRAEWEGRSPCAMAKSLGLAPTTLLGWQRTAPATSPFLPVVVRDLPPAPRAALSLVLPSGVRVEGLSLDDVATLCRKVGS